MPAPARNRGHRLAAYRRCSPDQREVSVRASLQRGPVGLGSYLAGHTGSWSEPEDVEVWLLVLFFPVVPLSVWRVSGSPQGIGMAPESVEVAIHLKSRISVRRALTRVAKAVVVGALAVLPLCFAVWQLGGPWAAPLLTAVFGSLLGPSVVGKIGSAVEMCVVFGGAALPVLLLMHLDERTPRVPLRVAVGKSK